MDLYVGSEEDEAGVCVTARHLQDILNKMKWSSLSVLTICQSFKLVWIWRAVEGSCICMRVCFEFSVIEVLTVVDGET